MVAAFLVCVGVAWVVMPLWALSTWTHRKSLYVRVRQPVWLLTDIAIILGLLTIIGLKQALMESGRNLPCGVSNGGAALGMVWVPGVVLCRCLQLWYALTLMELKHGRLAMVRRFYALLSGLLFLLALLAVLLATGDRALCISDRCVQKGRAGGEGGRASVLIDFCGRDIHIMVKTVIEKAVGRRAVDVPFNVPPGLHTDTNIRHTSIYVLLLNIRTSTEP